MTNITATRIEDEQERMSFLPSLTGSYFLRFEHLAFRSMEQATDDYGGGFWNYVKLSNGSGYMFPASDLKTFRMGSMNAWLGDMSPEAAGIAISLCAFSWLSFDANAEGNQSVMFKLAENFHALREYAAEHKEAAAIFAFID
jgi:hypothetical protein